ncbi:MAG: hypothetical protein ACK48R_03025, partial [Planctomyces sp.]
MNRTAIFVVLGFSGLILLAAAMVWSPANGKRAETGVQEPVQDSVSSEVRAAAVATAAGAPQTPLQFTGWPKPSFVLVATAEQRGYFEPCGCTANQLGGMTRRAGLFRQLESLGWSVRGVDAGSISSRTGSQAQMKFE